MLLSIHERLHLATNLGMSRHKTQLDGAWKARSTESCNPTRLEGKAGSSLRLAYAVFDVVFNESCDSRSYEARVICFPPGPQIREIGDIMSS